MFILDFDHTLYDTHLLSKSMKSVFLSYDILLDDFEKSYKLAIYGENGNYVNYTFERQLKILKKIGYSFDYNGVLDKLDALLEENRLFDDTIDFLEFIKNLGLKNILLTAGNDKFQKKKIEAVGISDYFDDIKFVHNGKEKLVKSFFSPQNKLFFINDNLQENLAVKNTVAEVEVLTKKNQYKNTEEELIKSGIPFFNNLTDIKKYVAGQV
ncbi:MAG: HAD hydrolase-like protein [Candidatus Magasanikbacteria bacterium]|nr:HAD hydrolase-like protein [Candidatus Magasanikbacteria bacterium]